MPKNKGKGGKKKKRGKNEAEDEKRELRYKEVIDEEYAQVIGVLGDCRCEAMCMDGIKRLCHIPGKFKNKVFIRAGDIILVGLRAYQDEKVDVTHKYMPDEVRRLKAYGELPVKMLLNEGIAWGHDEEDNGASDDYVDFEDEDIDKI